MRSAVVYVVLILVLVWSFTAFRSAQQENFISYSQVRSYFLNEQVTAFQVEDNQTLVLQLEDGKVWYHRLADVELFYNDLGDVIDQQQADGTLKEFDIQPAYEMPLWLQITIPIVGTVVVVMVIWGVMAMRQQNAQGGQGGMSRFGKAVPTRRRPSCKSWWTFCATPKNTLIWVPASPRACCWWALRAPVRPCWPRPWQGRRG